VFEVWEKNLVEIGLIGVGHNAIVSVTCAECFKKVGFSDVFKDMETHKVLLHAGEHKEIFGPYASLLSRKFKLKTKAHVILQKSCLVKQPPLSLYRELFELCDFLSYRSMRVNSNDVTKRR
jgi:hypothetical protein